MPATLTFPQSDTVVTVSAGERATLHFPNSQTLVTKATDTPAVTLDVNRIIVVAEMVGGVAISKAPENTIEARNDGLYAAPKLSSANW